MSTVRMQSALEKKQDNKDALLRKIHISAVPSYNEKKGDEKIQSTLTPRQWSEWVMLSDGYLRCGKVHTEFFYNEVSSILQWMRWSACPVFIDSPCEKVVDAGDEIVVIHRGHLRFLNKKSQTFDDKRYRFLGYAQGTVGLAKISPNKRFLSIVYRCSDSDKLYLIDLENIDKKVVQYPIGIPNALTDVVVTDKGQLIVLYQKGFVGTFDADFGEGCVRIKNRYQKLGKAMEQLNVIADKFMVIKSDNELTFYRLSGDSSYQSIKVLSSVLHQGVLHDGTVMLLFELSGNKLVVARYHPEENKSFRLGVIQCNQHYDQIEISVDGRIHFLADDVVLVVSDFAIDKELLDWQQKVMPSLPQVLAQLQGMIAQYAYQFGIYAANYTQKEIDFSRQVSVSSCKR